MWQKVLRTGKKHCGEKGEIARYEQFLLFPQCFQKACFQGASKGVIVGNGLTPYHTIPTFNDPEKETQCFLPIWISFCHFH